MKQSQLFTKTRKETPKDEVSLNAQLLIRAGFADKLMAGVYTFLPLGLRVMKKIEGIIREEMNAIGGQEFFMPSLQPKEIWEMTGRWKAMDDLYKLKDASDREFALGATHEEVIVPLMKKFVSSYKDLPLYAYQFQNKFRMELRSKSGLLRGREFIMKDLYSFHLDEKNLNEYYEKAKDAYFKIFARLGIGEKTHLTFASGGSFSKYSHEFQTISSAGEDTIYVCENCGMAINKEIKSEVKECPECSGIKFKEEEAIEVGNIFKLMNKYSKPFGFTVKDECGENREVLMGCYGIGLSRAMGTAVELNHDEKGVIWPEEIAPFKAHLLALNNESRIMNYADNLYKELLGKGIEVLYDDREARVGEKFADADLIGIPYRIVVSEKSIEKGGMEVKKRNEDKSSVVSFKDIGKIIKNVS